MVLCKILNETHIHTSQFNWGVERKRWWLAAEEEREVTVRAFSAYGHPLEMATSFRYLGQGISEVDDNCTVVVRNLVNFFIAWVFFNFLKIEVGLTATTRTSLVCVLI